MPYIPLTAQAYLTAMVIPIMVTTMDGNLTDTAPMPITATGPTEILGGTAASTGVMAGVGILGGAAAMAGMVVGIMDGEGGMATTDWHDEAWWESVLL